MCIVFHTGFAALIRLRKDLGSLSTPRLRNLIYSRLEEIGSKHQIGKNAYGISINLAPSVVMQIRSRTSIPLVKSNVSLQTLEQSSSWTLPGRAARRERQTSVRE